LDLIDTNNVIVNAILNSKYQEASEKGIVFVVKVNDLSDVKIEDEDIVLILSNLLNNAIEASEKCDEAVIKLKFVKENNQIVISVTNTMSTAPSVNGNMFVTSKTEDADMHGIGIENIKEAVEKYGGSYVIKHDRGSFRFAILIPS
jgi:sensor histidine kinase regulating citrate/malate metabolism